MSKTTGDEPLPARRPRRKVARKAPDPEVRGSAPPSGAGDAGARRPRQALLVGATLLAIGLALVGTEASDVGPAVTLAALVILLYGVHSFGRLGPGGHPGLQAPLPKPPAG